MTDERARFFYLLRTQYENLGDRVINRECLSLLRSRGQLIVNVQGVPGSFVSGLGLLPDEICDSGVCFYEALFSAARKSKKNTYLVLVPGAQAGDFSVAEMLRHTVLATAYLTLKAAGVQIIRLGASLGPFSARRARVERLKAQSMKFIGVRDHLSLNYARKLGLTNVGHSPDMAWMLPTRPYKEPSSDLYIVLSFRAEGRGELDALMPVVNSLIDQLDPDCTHRLIVSAQVERDRATCAALIDRLGQSRAVSTASPDDGEAALFELYGGARAVISNRLHVLLFALSRGARIWALTHRARNPKIIGLFEDVGLAGRLIDLEGPQPYRLPQPDPGVDVSLFPRMKGEIAESLDGLLTGGVLA